MLGGFVRGMGYGIIHAQGKIIMSCLKRTWIMFFTAVCAVVVHAVDNPSFEGGFDNWTAGKNMSIDGEVFHSGGAAAKVVVDDPLKDEVYLSRTLPIIGGAGYAASCWIRTENVELSKCRDTSVGAGMIIEWADADGRYIGWGSSTYNNFGTRDWFQIKSGPLRAPPNAARALITLCLRGKGTAWFDDFSFNKSLESVKKASPIDGIVLTNNTPAFAWTMCTGVTNYVLRLSRNRTFPNGGEIVINCGGRLRYQLWRPLVKGRWYWKVTATGMDDNNPWSFGQEAEESADCLPPLVIGTAARVTSSKQSFSVWVSDSSGVMPFAEYAGGKSSARGDIRDGKFKLVISPPPEGWKRGITDSDIITRDAAGNIGRFRFYLLNAPKPANVVTMDHNGNYRLNGAPYFPLGIYQVTKPYLREVRDAGFDVVHMYRWEKIAESEPCRDYLDACAEVGLRAFVGFDRGTYTKNGLKDGNQRAIISRIEALADHSALFCWYLYDEPELLSQFVSPDMMADYASLIRALDPWHPVVMSTWANANYRSAWDSHWTQSYGRPHDVFIDFGKYRAKLGDSPITLILGAYDDGLSRRLRQKELIDPDEFWLDVACFRASANIGIANGTNGLMWWWFAKEDGSYYSASKSPRAWRDLTTVVREIAALRPLLAEAGEVSRGVCGDPESEVVWWAKRTSSRTVAFVVNTSDKSTNVNLDLPGLGCRKIVLDRYEVRQIDDK